MASLGAVRIPVAHPAPKHPGPGRGKYNQYFRQRGKAIAENSQVFPAVKPIRHIAGENLQQAGQAFRKPFYDSYDGRSSTQGVDQKKRAG